MNVRFVFRPSESASTTAPGFIVCYLTVDKQRVKFTTPVRCQRRQWDATAQRLTGTAQAARLANAALTDIQAGLNNHYYAMERHSQHITCARLLKAFRGGGGKLTFLQAWQQFIAQREPMIGRDFSQAKWDADERRGRLLEQYLERHDCLDLLPEEFTAKHADAFLRWMRSRRDLSQNYASKVLQTVQQVLHWCVKEDIAPRYPLEGYRLRFAPPTLLVYLTPQELQQLRAFRFASDALQRVADCFIFQCYSGLAYVDLARFRRSEHTRRGGGGRWQLYMERQKTSHSTALPAVVPLSDEALALLDKYGEALPVPTNQVYNRMLKEVAAAAGLPMERLTSHVGRKTCGALLLYDGMSMEAVSRALGHSSVKMTQRHYVSITETIVEREHERIYGGKRAA